MPQRPPRYQPFPNRPAPPQADRPTAAERGYDHRWQQFRLSYLAEHPLCVTCEAEGRGPVEATCIDHKDGKGPLGEAGYDEANLQALCASCHGKKTARHDGGFGHEPRK
jgi:5-methylcytosine-specific restriction enzyme A